MPDIESIVQSLIAQGVITQEEVDAKVAEYQQKNETDPKGVNKKIKLVEDATFIDLAQTEAENAIKARIDSGEITAATFGSLTADEQNLTKLVLFKQYTPKHEDTARALSAIEFSLVFLVKFLAKAVDTTKLTAEVQTAFTSLVNIFNLNDMPINSSSDWRFQYLNAQFTQTQNNRADYFAKKSSVTGNA